MCSASLLLHSLQRRFAPSHVFILFSPCTDTPPRFFYFSTRTCEINQIKRDEGRIYGRFPSAWNEAERDADGRPTAFCAESVIAKFTGISVEEAEGLPENHQMCQRAPEWKKMLRRERERCLALDELLNFKFSSQSGTFIFFLSALGTAGVLRRLLTDDCKVIHLTQDRVFVL